MMRSVVVSICDSFSGAFDQQDDADQPSQTAPPCCTMSTSTKIAIMLPASRMSRPKPDQAETAHDNAERSKPPTRIFGKRQRTSDDCGDNRGVVCVDGATPFVKSLGRSRNG